MPGSGAGREHLEALNHITFAINATLDLDHIFQTIDREAKRLVKFHRLSFALMDRRHRDHMRVYSSGAGDEHASGQLVPIRGRLAQVADSRRPIVVPHLDPATLDENDPTDQALVAMGIRSIVCMPLLAKGDLVGILNLGSRTGGQYSKDDLPLLQQIAAQLALAIEKARLLGEERRRAEQLRLLNEVAKEVVSSLERDAMITRVVRLVHQAFDFVHLSCFLCDDDAGVLRLVAVSGRWADKVPLGWELPVDKGVLGKCVTQARPYLAEDTSADPNYEPYPGIDSRTELGVPLISRGKVLGCLNAESHLVGAFDHEDVKVLLTIADQLASGIVNANLYAEVASFNTELERQVAEKTKKLTEAYQQIERQKELLARENINLRATLKKGSELVGESRQLKALLAVVDKVAPTDAPVLIQGESGTGKELVAARIHRLSRVADGPYVTINCGALPETLLESELFGHEPGSFTGADRLKPGLVETAEGGTLFLDEIGEMPRPLQSKLLRFLENGEFYRIGGKRALKAHTRIVSATNRDLRKEVAAGRFREDLFFRLNTITLEMPPLRERPGDIARLARHFLDRFRRGRELGIGDELMDALLAYHWPGNVRELANLMERLAILSDEGDLGLDYVPPYILEGARRGAGQNGEDSRVRSLKDMEREHIRWALSRNHGDKTRTAKQLGISLKTLYNKIERYGI